MAQHGDAVLAIDVGTTAIKTAVIDGAGLVVWHARRLQPQSAPRPGWVEQDADTWWRSICELLASAPPASLGRVAAISVTGHNPTLVCVGPDMAPRRPAMTWADTRAVEEARTLAARIGRPADASLNVPKAMWLESHDPESLRGALLFQTFDYIVCRLSGARHAQSPVPGWPAWDAAQVEASGLDPTLFPTPGPALGSVVGCVSGEAARATGLAAGRPIIAGLVDGLASWIGTGTLEAGEFFAGAGTSAGANLCWRGRIDDPRRRVASLPHPLGGDRFMAGGPMSSGSRFIDWLASSVCGTSVETMIEEASRIPAGAGRVIALPYLSGERTPIADPTARGVFVGLAGGHTRAHLGRAALEAVAFAVRDVMDVLVELGASVSTVRVGGGGAASATWNQIKADVLQRPVAVPEVRDASLMGAAVVAAWGVGLHASGDAAARAMVRVARVFEPVPEPAYDELFALYRSTYQSLQPVLGVLAQSGGLQ
jgi:xylulokinase